MSWVTEIRRRLEGELRTPDEIREAAYLLTGDVTAKLTRFWLLLTLSAVRRMLKTRCALHADSLPAGSTALTRQV